MTSKKSAQQKAIIIQIKNINNTQCSSPNNIHSKFYTRWYKSSGNLIPKFLVSNNSDFPIMVKFQLSPNGKDYISTASQIIINSDNVKTLQASIVSKYTRLVYKYLIFSSE